MNRIRWQPRFVPDLPGVIAISLSEADPRIDELRTQLGYSPAAVRPTAWAHTALPPLGRALPCVGHEVEVAAEPFVIVHFDQRAFAIVPYRGAHLPAGPVWIVPSMVAWQPRGAEIERLDEHTWDAGPLRFTASMHDDQRGELEIAAEGVRLGAHPFEGSCAPVAVWLVEPHGPALVVLYDFQYVVYGVGATSMFELQRISL